MRSIKKLKIGKKIILLTLAGTISLTSTGCNKKQIDNKTVLTEDIDNIDDLENNISNDKQKENLVIHMDYDSDKEISKEKTSSINITVYQDNIYGYLKENVKLRKSADKDSKKITKIEKYEKVKLIEKANGWTLVKYNKQKGFIKSTKIKKINKAFHDVDISEQTYRYYNKNGKVVIKTPIVTGNYKTNDTNKGCHKIMYKTTNAVLKGADYQTPVDYWMPFNTSGEGLHDAYWRSSFGKEIYKGNGSHGCVNLPKEVAPKVYKKAKVGDMVLVHK